MHCAKLVVLSSKGSFKPLASNALKYESIELLDNLSTFLSVNTLGAAGAAPPWVRLGTSLGASGQT